MVSFLDRLLGRTTRKHYLAIDVGSNTAIRSLLFEADPDGRDPRARKKLHHELPDRQEIHTTIKVIQNELKRIIFQYVRELGRLPDETLIGLGSHFTFNTTERISYPRPKPNLKITIEEIKDFLINKLGNHQKEKTRDGNWHLAIAAPFVIEADGYRIEKIGKSSTARTITFTLLNTYATHDFWQMLQDLRSMFGGINIAFLSNQTALAEIIVKLLALEEALVLKIGAKITEVSYLKSRAVLSSGQFGFGGDNFTKAIAHELSVSFSQAEEIKQQTGKLIHDSVTQERVKLALQKAVGQWLNHLVQFLEAQADLVLPETIFLLGGGARLDEIRNILAASEWHRDFTFLPRLTVVRLEGRDLSRMIFQKSSPPLDGPEEVALAGLVYKLLQHREVFEVSSP